MSSRFAGALEKMVREWEKTSGVVPVLSVNRKMGLLERDEDVLLETVAALLAQFCDVPGLEDVEIQAFRRADQVLLIVSRAASVASLGGEGEVVSSSANVSWSDEVLPKNVRQDLEAIGARALWTHEGNGRLQCMVKLGR